MTAPKPTIVACSRVVDRARDPSPLPEGTIEICSGCEFPVHLAHSTRSAMALYPNPRILCVQCTADLAKKEGRLQLAPLTEEQKRDVAATMARAKQGRGS